MVEPTARLGARHLILAECRHLQQADFVADRIHFLGYDWEHVRAAERIRLWRVCGKILGIFQAIAGPEVGAGCFHLRVQGRGLEPTSSRKLFVRVGDAEAAGVVFLGLLERVCLRCPPAEARDIHCEDVGVGLRPAMDHPFRQAEPHSAALRKARHDRTSHPIVAHVPARSRASEACALNRPDQRVPVRRKGEGAVHDASHTCLLQHGVAGVGLLELRGDAVQVGRQQLVLAVIPWGRVRRPGPAIWLVDPQEHTPALGADVVFAVEIDGEEEAGILLEVFRDEVMVLHR
mmetsp:Transcript_51654/g.135621  ORF Transcript_51654/g.135621 Transcript_51654/m.135621 type:complete len:290 (-) Transcript_51654:810-1679(-)